ncbi:MAG: ABC transporter ATP-binding protein [Bdellovibrionales bacterium CG12_big_fil_rev_8_21_14_0_65_38_15]|nr:MAG: ABC transporter ATP-binding protein [Bdellovibrionales bacterium CG22_combo_CG10-13_8_21_14_all_38_13]PIQ56227.1 MAG: ABC transporter ATP-binding protein [Bdellovibrionales bacterium CG12_big_fil_rev_8_21_14_0_65_38_15]PIR30371.1 MAG: ABC transporter ATP-binding protein [Bdellovibrionales bacterium CG11_big_fil_rev_8_21_14_0_20_38_13]
MISTSNLGMSFGGQKLFEDVNIKFTPGNCYGLIGANGAGKSTFLKILSGEIEAQTGDVIITPGQRLSTLKQDHYAHEEDQVLMTVLMGNKILYNLMIEKDAIYAKPDFSDADGIKVSELEEKFTELGGWEAEPEAANILAGLGLGTEYLEKKMKELNGGEKVKVLLAQAIFGTPDILLLDEPTNDLDIASIQWLENFIMNYKNTVIVVSHDRHFLNKVCTHIADIDFRKINTFVGNYDFWRKSSELAMHLRGNENKKMEEKAKELKAFIARFSANASKSSQATSRQKQLDKLQLHDLPVSTRKYPYVHFVQSREAGKEVLKVDGLCKTIDGVKLLDNLSFSVNKEDKIVILGNDVAKTTLFQILMGEMEPDAGSYTWGVTITKDYFPADNSKYFKSGEYDIVNWLRQYSEDQHDTFLRGFLGKMLFSGEDVFKKTNVLSGGEKVRCMFAKMMLSGANALVLDGPTSHLDLESITAVNDGLIDYKGTLIFTSHDHEFIQTIANRIIEIDKKLVYDKYITYDEYLEAKLS